jgi:hypothetical protein
MRFGGQIDELAGDLPGLEFVWEPGTEILSGKVLGVDGTRGYTGSIEFEDARGAVLTLDVHLGVFIGIEIVVWPTMLVVEGLDGPEADRLGRLVVSARPSQPGIGIMEIDVPIAGRKSPDGSIVHLQVGELGGKDRVAVADGLVLELDRFGDLAGFWLIDVPPCPTPS